MPQPLSNGYILITLKFQSFLVKFPDFNFYSENVSVRRCQNRCRHPGLSGNCGLEGRRSSRLSWFQLPCRSASHWLLSLLHLGFSKALQPFFCPWLPSLLSSGLVRSRVHPNLVGWRMNFVVRVPLVQLQVLLQELFVGLAWACLPLLGLLPGPRFVLGPLGRPVLWSLVQNSHSEARLEIVRVCCFWLWLLRVCPCSHRRIGKSIGSVLCLE